jgi:serine protease AprX
MKRALRHLPFGLAVIITALSVTAAPITAASTASRGATRLDAQLRGVLGQSAPAPQRVIIRVRPGSRPALRDSLTAHGNLILSEHESIDALTAVVHGEDLATLGDNDAVLSVSTDAIVRPHGLLDGLLGGVGGLLGGVLNVVGGVVQGLVQVVGSIILPNGADTGGPVVAPAILRQTLGVDGSQWTGRGIGVAVIDSGLEMSAEFQYRVTAFYDFTNGGLVAAAPHDDYGHGTHVAGTIGGSGALSSNSDYHGLAPRVKLVILKVLDKTGAGYTSDVIRAIDFAVANRSTLGIDIINLSLGHPIFEPAGSDPLVQAVERASRAGVIVVAAAGNYGKNPTTGLPGYGGITSPGNAPSAITAGAVNIQNTVTRSDDRIPDYSSAGPTWYDAYVKPDVVSPGHNIVAVAARSGYLYKTYPQLTVTANPNYMILSGTSMATAVTTGSIALMLEANRAANSYSAPRLTPNAVKAVLQYTAIGIHDDAGLEYDGLRKGAGALNTKGAIDLGREINTSTHTGSWWLTSNPYPSTTIGGETLAWNQAIIWGTNVAWGTSVGVNETAWSNAIIWGTGTSWSSAIIWGTNVAWSNPQSWANAIIWGTDTIGQSNGTAIIWGTTVGLNSQNVAWQSLSGSTTSTSTTGQ